MEIKLKPNKWSFVFYFVLNKFLVLVLLELFFLISLLSEAVAVLGFVVVLNLVLLFIFLFLALISYSKTKYSIGETQIVWKTGGLFYDKEQELNIKNITNVYLNRPFIGYKLFKTYNLAIQSSGSSSTEISIVSIEKGAEILKGVIARMGNLGFDLGKSEIVQEAKPHKLAVFFETFRIFIIGLFVLVFIFGSFFTDLYMNGYQYFSVILFLGGLIIVLLKPFFAFLDLAKREYRIYGNKIEYYEGFLARNYALIPMENLTDSRLTQTFVDKLFGLNDIALSCQGGGREISFGNLDNASEISDRIGDLIGSRKKRSAGAKAMPLKKGEPAVSSRISVRDEAGMDSSHTADFKIHPAREYFGVAIIFGSLIVAFVLALLLASARQSGTYSSLGIMIGAVIGLAVILGMASIVLFVSFIKVKFTQYSIRKRSFFYSYDFLFKRSSEFLAKNVTSVTILRSFVDNWFDTLTARFTSMGGSFPILFASIKRMPTIVSDMLDKVGIKNGEIIYQTKPTFSIAASIKANLIIYLLGVIIVFTPFLMNIILPGNGLLALSVILILLALIIVGSLLLYKTELFRRSRLVFFKKFLCYETGLLKRVYTYVKYEDIKDVRLTKYIFSEEGTLEFNIVGDKIRQNVKSGILEYISNRLCVPYLQAAGREAEIINSIIKKELTGKAEIKDFASPNTFKSALIKRIAGESMLQHLLPGLILGNLFFIPLSIFTAFVLLSYGDYGFWVAGAFSILILLGLNCLIVIPKVLIVRCISYNISRDSLLKKSGVFYKQEKTIPFKNIDFINIERQLSHKIFGTATISVNTIGSMHTEMYIANIKNYKEVYDRLKKEYQANKY